MIQVLQCLRRVKKAVFPLEILPIVVVAQSLDYADHRFRDCGASESRSGSHDSMDCDLPAANTHAIFGVIAGNGPVDQHISVYLRDLG